MPLDPQVQSLLDQFAAPGQAPLNEIPVEEGRQVALLLATFDGEPEAVDTVEDRAVPGPGGEIPVRVYRPARTDPLPVVAWFHAGGAVVGDLETADRTCRKLANRSGALIVSVDYRRAPEHRFPAAVNDCWTVTRWIADHASELGGDPHRLAVGGDSVGGGFAAAVAQRAAREGAPALRHQLLVCPFLDMTLQHPSMDEYADGYLVTKVLIGWFADHYLGPDGDPTDLRASPLLAPGPTGCAPATIVTAEFDPARDEAIEYAKKLTGDGVPVVVDHYDGMIHIFFALGGVVDRAEEAMTRSAGALRAALA
jgi:acetyl esterase